MESDNSSLERNIKFLSGSKLPQPIITDLSQKETSLNHFDIVRVLGKGKLATVYLLSNEHIVKIGKHRNPHDKDFYLKYMNQPSKNFIVYQYEDLSMPGWFIVETTRFIPFFDFIGFFNPNNKTDLKNEPDFLERLRKVLRTNNLPMDEFKSSPRYEYNKKLFFAGIESIYHLPTEITERLWNYIIDSFKEVGPWGDSHFGNLGVDVTGGFDNAQFFFFDR